MDNQKRAAIDADDGASAGKRGEGKSEADQHESFVAMLHAQVNGSASSTNNSVDGEDELELSDMIKAATHLERTIMILKL